MSGFPIPSGDHFASAQFFPPAAIDEVVSIYLSLRAWLSEILSNSIDKLNTADMSLNLGNLNLLSRGILEVSA
jgi:hypothetical protein